MDLSAKIQNFLRYKKLILLKCYSSFFTRILCKLKGVSLGNRINFYGVPLLVRFNNSTISIGNNCTFRSDNESNLIGVNRKCIISTHGENAKISIGENCGLSGATIAALEEIFIGKNTLIGANVIVTDFDWHNIDPLSRRAPCFYAKPIYIGENVFIGVNSVILKGVSVGKNSIIGAGSVVTQNVPENCIVAGNPATIVKHFK